MFYAVFFVFYFCLFFFFKQKTAYEMRISDWSSDVCSSDLTKPYGVAVHYRQEPGAAPAVFIVMDAMAAREALAARRGKMVVELGPKSADKGLAVARLMAAPPFAGALPLFIGDDTTDEDGFAAVAAAGGHGILVGAPRPTAAHFRLADPEAVHQWLTL